MARRIALILHFSLFILPVTKAQELRLADVTYEPKIETVLLYPAINNDVTAPARTLNPPIISQTDEATPLMLEFDDLTAQYKSFRAKVVHCNSDWQKSVLNDIEFTYTYNDHPITDYQLSINTKVQFYHYRFSVPRVKLPGNYVLVVYDERNPRHLILSRRFSTYQNLVAVDAGVRFSTDPQRQFSDQQIDLTLSYKGYQVISPQDDFKIVIRQNYRDDRVITGLKATNVRAFDQVLEFQSFDLVNTIPGGNEYRFFDTRTVFSQGNYVDRINRLADKNVAYIMADLPRSTGSHFQSDDFNGQYIIDQRESGDGATNADYIETVFTLKLPELPDGDMYVNGAFNYWQLNDRNRMTFDPATGAYRAAIWLKQGVYNYNYALLRTSPKTAVDERLIEGSYSATENEYEVFVYNRPPASRADQLVGYRRMGVNRRR